MKQLQPDLWQSSKYSSGALNTHAYFLQRGEGNVLFYNTSSDDDLNEISEMGGIQYQLLSHRDESGPSLNRIKERFKSQLGCSALEAAIISKDASVDMLFRCADTELGDIKIIHTPGHTDGSICFLYSSPYGKSYLFTGDTLFQWNGDWETLVIESAGGSKAALLESLQKLRGLRPDVVLSSGSVGDVSVVDTSGDEWISAIDRNIASLKRGL